MIFGLALLCLIVSASALDLQRGPGRDLLAAKCKTNDKKEYYGNSAFIKKVSC